MEVLLILAVVVGVVVGVGSTTWQLALQDTGGFAWLVDTATDLSELEKNLNHLSEQGFGVHHRPSIYIALGWPAAPIVIGS